MVAKSPQKKCWTYFADAMRLALRLASSKSLWTMRTLLLLLLFSAVRKFLQDEKDLVCTL